MASKYLRGGAIKMSDVTLETNTQITLTANLEDASSKDDAEGWDKQEITSRSWSVQSDRLVEAGGTTAGDLLKKWIDQSGADSISISLGTAGSLEGAALLTQLDIDATVKQNVTVSATFTGVGSCE